MEIENKLDEDFLFYLTFINRCFSELKNKADADRCREWLQKLCGSPCVGVDQKRNRNIYLSNLILCMQEGTLSEPFSNSPIDVDISNAANVFEDLPSNIIEPDWLEEIANAPDDDDVTRDGRTYLATRTLPGGEGAFAYLAVTLADDEPRWLGGGEGLFERAMEQKFREYMPPMSEMERILLRRKDPVEREKVLAYYEALLQNINSELDEGIAAEDNDIISGLIDQLIKDLKEKKQYQSFEAMPDKQRRVELLIILHDRIYARRKKVIQILFRCVSSINGLQNDDALRSDVTYRTSYFYEIAKREEVLDDIEQRTMPLSFFNISVQPEDKVELPAAMWEQAINKMPNRKNMDALFDNYPHILIEKFLDLLSNEKEDIALRMQKRHENIVAQMRKELRKEGEKGRAKADEAELYFRQVESVLTAVKAAYEKQAEALRKTEEKKKSDMSEQTQLYEQLRAALFDTQKSVEEEAERGHLLRDQINSLNAQTELYQQVNDDSIRKTEAANIALMKNIKRLRNAVKQYEGRIAQIQAMAGVKTKKGASQDFYYF